LGSILARKKTCTMLIDSFSEQAADEENQGDSWLTQFHLDSGR